MNEIAIVKNYDTGNATLNKMSESIGKAINTAINSAVHVAHLLNKVNESGLIEDSYYADIFQYASENFGFKKPTVSLYLKTAKRYIHETEVVETMKNGKSRKHTEITVLHDATNKPFTLSQMQEICQADEETAESMLECYEITADMSCKKIREAIKTRKEMDAIDKAEENEQEENETEENEQEEKEPDYIEVPTADFKALLSACEQAKNFLEILHYVEADEMAGKLFDALQKFTDIS